MSKKTQSYTNRKHRKYIPERMPGNVAVKNKGGWLPGANGRAAKVEALLRGRKEETKEIAGNMAGYKDSGVEWIGAIPKGWKFVPLKDSFYFVAGGTPLSNVLSNWDEGVAWVTPADFKTDKMYISKGARSLSKKGYQSCNAKMLPPGSIIFSKRAPIGSVAINTAELCTNQGCIGLLNKTKNANNKYFYYILSIATQTFEALGAGVTFKEISIKNFGNVSLPLPPLPEQQRIADFLDTKCGILDRTIDAVSRQIEDLEKYKKALITKTVTKGICKKGEPERAMKDSGVEWIGEDIPFDWDINRLQFCIDEISERNYAGKETHILSLMKDKGVIPYEEKGRVGNISKTDLTQYKLAYQNTLITNSMNIIIGSSGISQYKGCVSPAYYVFKAKPNNDIRYFNYIFAVRAFQNECRRFANGILEIRLRISSTNLLKIKVPVPPLAEQQQIADYLDEKCKNIDNRVQKRRQQLEWLKEYKKSMIFDYVTGKKRVEK